MQRNRLDQVLVRLSVWTRRQPWLRALAGALPTRWRGDVAQRLHATAVGQLHFPSSPTWPALAQATTAGATRAGGAGRDTGINLVGYLRGEFGLAEAARLYAGALLGSGMDVALRSVELPLPHGWNDRSLEPWIGSAMPHRDTLVFINPDYLAEVATSLPIRRDADHRVFACWFWELESLPAHWQPAIDAVDGILVASRFVEGAFRARTDKPILRVPLPLPDSLQDAGTAPVLARRDFDLEEGKFIFLCMFDFHSSMARKHPLAVVAAFRKAFPPGRQDVRLLIKTSNAEAAPDALAQLLGATAGDARIVVRNQHLQRGHLHALQACCDAYVSLHRAEGFGLVMAEAMALGKPVIATGWSGNREFMDAGNSRLVDYTLVDVPPGDYPDAAGARWAEPDPDDAARAMAELADDPALARELGKRAAASVRQQLSAAAAAARIQAWLRAPAPAVATVATPSFPQQPASQP